jgi:hypothetical protein
LRWPDICGLNGEEEVMPVDLAQPGDAGGPVYDNGAVLGMLIDAKGYSGQSLPPEALFSVDADQIVASIIGAGLTC